MGNNINLEKVVNHWIDTSNEDFDTMMKLYDSKSYHWSLFLGHISTEKLLKALYVKRNRKHAPFTHNLYRLAEKINLDMDHEMEDWLDQITVFNLNARYDDYKREFYNLCTENYCKEWIEKIEIIRNWIFKML
ncbi:HEPN domain-containing protein [Marivirga tractuosa]|uniref:HEPN domain-containing protein n=1 Tax=Marivirga tractuosa TaxID=1006 RepID=UPI0035CF4EB1